MPEDRSLDEFAGASGGESASTEDEGSTSGENGGAASSEGGGDASGEDGGDASGEDGEETGSVAASDANPATTTSAWTGGGRRCERCGDTVQRLWGAEGTLVCPECKDW